MTAPIGLSAAFATQPSKQTQWLSFVRKHDVRQLPLASTVALLHSKLSRPLFMAASTDPGVQQA